MGHLPKVFAEVNLNIPDKVTKDFDIVAEAYASLLSSLFLLIDLLNFNKSLLGSLLPWKQRNYQQEVMKSEMTNNHLRK